MLELRGAKLPNKDGFFGKSDPFYVVLRATEQGGWAQTFCSPVVRDNLSPTWPPQTIMPHDRLGAGDDICPLKIEVFDSPLGWHYSCTAVVLIYISFIRC